MRILVVEDEEKVAGEIVRALTAAGHAVERARDGEEAWFQGDTEDFDLVVLDLGLPKLDGVQVLKRWRANGAHDAGPYPDGARRLVREGGRHRCRRRRLSGEALPHGGADGARAGAAAAADETRHRRADHRRRDARHAGIARASAGVPVDLSPMEYRLLHYLMHHEGRAVPQAELTEHIYTQYSERDSNAIEVTVARLRRKLGARFRQDAARLRLLRWRA